MSMSTVFTPPDVVGLFGNANLVADLCGGLSLSEARLGFPKLVNGLLGSIAFLGMIDSPLQRIQHDGN